MSNDNKKEYQRAVDECIYGTEVILSGIMYMIRTKKDYIGCEWQFLRDYNVELQKAIKELQSFTGAFDRYVSKNGLNK